MLFIRNLLQPPSAAPTSSTSGGSIQVLHRRVNLDGRVTAVSPVRTGVTLPATLTPQSYTDTNQILRDEFLVSNDSGSTYKIVPRSDSGKGAQAIPAFDSGWVTAGSLIDNQLTQFTGIDLGNFTAGNSPNQTFWVYNDTSSPISSLTFEVRNAATGELYEELRNRVTFEILGTLDQDDPGTGILDTSEAATVTYNPPPLGINSSPVTLANTEAARIRVTLTNFPASFISGSLSATIEIIPNQTIFSIGNYSSWLKGAVWLNDFYTLPLVSSATPVAGQITLEPIAISTGSSAIINPAQRSFATPLTGTLRLEAQINGGFRVVASTDPIDRTIALPITQFNLDVSGNVTNVVQLAGARADTSYRIPDSALVAKRFCSIGTDGELELSDGTDVPVGVSLEEPGYFTQQGLALIETGGSFSVGAKLFSDATGRAITATSASSAIALEESTAAGQFRLVHFVAGAAATSGGGGSGTVTSVGLSAPSEFTVTGSPVTSSGNLTLDWDPATTEPFGLGLLNITDAEQLRFEAAGVYEFRQSTAPTQRPDTSALVAGDRWYDTDVFEWFYWNGTDWLSETVYNIILSNEVSTSTSLSMTTPIDPSYDILVIGIGVGGIFSSPNNATDDWTYTLRSVAGTTVVNYDTVDSSPFADSLNWQSLYRSGLSITIPFTALGGAILNARVSKNGSAGNLSNVNYRIDYRKIA